MKAEFVVGDVTVWLGAEGAEGIDRSRRSFRPDEAAGGAGFDAAVGDEKEEKSPKPLLLGARA